MRYPQAHAAKSGSIPFALRGPKSMRTALSVAVAAAIGLVPTVMVTSPAYADPGDISVAAVSVTEGGELSFRFVRTGGAEIPAASYSLAVTPKEESETNYTPRAGSDYVSSPSPTTISFPAASTANVTRTVVVRTVDDALFEGALPEQITLTATPTGGTTGDPIPVVGSINDNDDAPGYTITTNSPVTEANGAKATVTARLDAPSGLPVAVTLTTTNGTAIAGADFTAPVDDGDTLEVVENRIVIDAGKTSATKDIAIGKDDTRDSAEAENFTVNATATNTAAPANTSTQVTINDIDPLPKVTVDDSVLDSGDEGGSFELPLTLDRRSDKAVTVRWDATPPSEKVEEHEAATQGTDFAYPASTQRTVTIAAGTLEQAATISLTDDSLNEATEDFGIQLANPTNSELGTPSKIDVSIEDDDATQPEVSIDTGSLTVDEGNSGRASRTITAKLDAASGRTVRVGWTAAAAGTDITDATPYKDFTPKTGTLTFPAGTTTQTFQVDVTGDVIDEGDGEAFQVSFDDAVGATTAGPAEISIRDDDDRPRVTFDDAALPEGNLTSAVLLPVKLSNPSNHTLVFELADAATGTAQSGEDAVGGDDYTLASGRVTIRAEATSGSGVLLLNGDDINERDETVNLAVAPDTDSDDYLASASPDTATLTIEDEDKAPTFEVNDVTAEEGELASVTGTITGVSDQALTASVTFTGASVKGVKAADSADFTNPGTQTVTVDPGTEPGTVIPITDVMITDDEVNEPNETIRVTGTTLGNFGTVLEGAITIAASDGGKPTEPTEPEAPGAPSISTPAAAIAGVGNATIAGRAAANATVDLWGKPFGAPGEPTKIKSVQANATGNYSFTHRITQGFIFQTGVGELISKELAVRVKQNPVFTLTSPSKGSFTVTVTGNPKAAGQGILVQSYVSGAWKTVYKGKTGSNGVYTRTVKLASGKALTMRGFVAGDTGVGLLGSYSTTKKVTVK
ncbi:Calx-beta domain-containing protein [Actinoplanes sp. NPDC023936]|uniref:Calx-beta domain-containing protein n=1 Tax=Actinoplanes sp. NPDC023936 TaxID=3154910 RepID=UPI0033D5044B